ncbi:hypothetical protein IAG25_15705 [Caballeronia sp. EK]|uniref:hypothetical protein n=1 Tax=Caballeronia sp. EK TaxID=2767469 RepID=UPI001655CC81|nr:hypothetical protein [Caballeronia sp. EK]MBC8638267.1 hypothetical protein [Caballeronia sp. EK]
MNDMKLPPPAPKGKSQPPSFDLTKRQEIVETRAFGKVTVNDVGADAFERIAVDAKNDSDLMLRMLLVAAAVGPNGERFTVESLSAFPARCFGDRAKLLHAAARVNGLSGDEVEKA